MTTDIILTIIIVIVSHIFGAAIAYVCLMAYIEEKINIIEKQARRIQGLRAKIDVQTKKQIKMLEYIGNLERQLNKKNDEAEA